MTEIAMFSTTNTVRFFLTTLVILATVALMTGCMANNRIYEITHPSSGKVYETYGYRVLGNGKIVFVPRNTQDTVVLEEFELQSRTIIR